MADVAFWDRIADRYAARAVGNETAYAATLERVRAWLRSDMSVMEIGCGTGTTALRLAGSVAHYLGTDLSGEMLRIARGRAAGVPVVTFEQAAAKTAGAGQRFDAICAFNLMHLVEDRGAVLAHVQDRLSPGGLFISKTPCLGHKPWLRPVVWGMQCFGKAPSVAHFLKVAEWEQELVQAGFDIVETGDYPAGLPNHFVVARLR